MIYQMKLKDNPFRRISEGRKTIEIRLYDEKRRLVQPDDYIEFTNMEDGKKIKTKVIKLHLFNSFKELFDKFDNSYLGHDEKVDYKRMYDYYTEEEEKEYGVVGIEIKLVKGDE